MNLSRATIFLCIAGVFTSYGHFKNLKKDPCWAEDDYLREVMEHFITSENWSPERIETGTTHLSTSQIELLTNSQDFQTCVDLNEEFEEAIAATWNNNDRKFDFNYYKAGNFFFVITGMAQSSDPNILVSGVTTISIFDNNLNVLGGYSFR
ncbi:MAG: hypothetical protein CL670_12665 [Balneola sp.]|jgi:hypothetical protein|nr:hypothetical protein [Balneola sp.]MBE80000.1 hypothetical protein [Balneola sp.]HBX67693.1 hypothetical protein [Balneolaceae bacterium]|tara:strand:- start:335 stop:787 length:453 start_codon:yes stop_codon:yes gene_type:complete